MTDVGFGGNVGSAFSGFVWVRSDSISLPTGRAMFSGSTACLITAIGAYAGGDGATRTISLQLGSASTSNFTVPNDSHPVSFTGYISTNSWLVNGSSASFYIYTNSASVNFGRSSTSGAVNTYNSAGGTWTGTLGGAYRYVEAPSAPQTLTATTPTGTPTGRVSLSWAAPSSDGGSAVTSYNVYYSNGTYIGNTASTSYTVTGLTAGTSYSFVVRARNAVTDAASSQSVNSNTATAVASGIPTAPTALTGTSGTDAFGEVVLSWTAPSETYGTVTGYKILGTTGGIETLVATTTGTGTSSISVTGLTQRANYTFRVAARNAATDSLGTQGAYSTASASIQASGPPTAPTGLTAVVDGLNTPQRLVLSWTAPSNDGDPSGGITGYEIYYSTGVFIASTTGPGTTYNVDGLTPGVEYGFYVEARNAISDVVGTHSADSNVAYGTPVGEPDSPENLSATAVSSIKGAVLLMWDEVPFADGYLVYLNTTPSLTLLQTIPGGGNNQYVHYLDRTASSYSSLAYVVSAYNEFTPGGGPVSSPASATPNVTVLQTTTSTALSNLTNDDIYTGDFPVISTTSDTFTYARTAANLAESTVPATFGTLSNLTNDDLSGTYTISVVGTDSLFFSYTKAPDVGIGNIPSETAAVSSSATNNTNAIFNGSFTVDSLDGTDGIVYTVTGTNPSIAEVASTGTITNGSNTTFNVTAPITAATDSTFSFSVPGAPDESTSAAEGSIVDTTNRDVFNNDTATVLTTSAHNRLRYPLPGTPASLGAPGVYQYSNTITAGDPGSGFIRFNSLTASAITTLRLDDLNNAAVDVSAQFPAWNNYAGTEAFDGIVSFDSGGTPLLFGVSGPVVDSGGYFSVPVQYISGALPANNTLVTVEFYPYVSAEISSPYGQVRPANSKATLEVRYRSGWLA
ncbi:MAG: fibronectin type III domain-containing protein [Cetobacterium sp.]